MAQKSEYIITIEHGSLHSLKHYRRRSYFCGITGAVICLFPPGERVEEKGFRLFTQTSKPWSIFTQTYSDEIELVCSV